MAESLFKWHSTRFKSALQRKKDELLTAKAYEVLQNARHNIVTNGQVDTGYLHDSGYIDTEVVSTHGSIPTETVTLSSRTGQQVQRRGAETVPPRRRDEAIVGFSAEYAIHPELENSYLWRAVEQAASEGKE